MPELLPIGLRKGIFRAFYAAGYSANEAQRLAEGTNYATRRETILQWYREFRGGKEAGYNLNLINLDKKPNPDRLQASTSFLRGNYRFGVRWELKDAVLDREFFVDCTISFDQLPTRGEILDRATEILGKVADYYDFIIKKGIITMGLRRIPQ